MYPVVISLFSSLSLQRDNASAQRERETRSTICRSRHGEKFKSNIGEFSLLFFPWACWLYYIALHYTACKSFLRAHDAYCPMHERHHTHTIYLSAKRNVAAFTCQLQRKPPEPPLFSSSHTDCMYCTHIYRRSCGIFESLCIALDTWSVAALAVAAIRTRPKRALTSAVF